MLYISSIDTGNQHSLSKIRWKRPLKRIIAYTFNLYPKKERMVSSLQSHLLNSKTKNNLPTT